MTPTPLLPAQAATTPLPSRRLLLSTITATWLASRLPGLNEETAARKGNHRRKRRKHQKPRPGPQPTVQAAATCAAAETSGFGGNAPKRLAQTFTPSLSGALASADLKLQKIPGSQGDFILHLSPVDAFGVPTNEVLAAASVSNPSVPDEVSTVRFTFPTPVRVTANVPLALVLTRPGTTAIVWHAALGDACGGLTFESANQAAPFTIFASDLDFIFTVFVRA